MNVRTNAVGLLVAALCAAHVGAAAQIVGRTLIKGVAGVDLTAITPVVQSVLNSDVPGASRPWQSASANGEMRLLSGGAAAGAKCGRVKLTVDRAAKHSAYSFRYCRDAAGVWRTAG